MIAGGFAYRDRLGEQGPVTDVVIKRTGGGRFTIDSAVLGLNGPVAVVPPNPGTDAFMTLKLGLAPEAGDRYCVQYGPESDIMNNGPFFFSATNPVEQGCPPVPGTTTTSSSTTRLDLLDDHHHAPAGLRPGQRPGLWRQLPVRPGLRLALLRTYDSRELRVRVPAGLRRPGRRDLRWFLSAGVHLHQPRRILRLHLRVGRTAPHTGADRRHETMNYGPPIAVTAPRTGRAPRCRSAATRSSRGR
jgi:hypothetical protein